jgi:protein gp37
MIWWTKSWNPIVGCTKCSPACANCYAEATHTMRHKALLEGKNIKGESYTQPFDQVRFLPERLENPLHWKAPQRIFVGNMGDLFHEDVEAFWLDRIFATMSLCPQHTFMLLTKRPDLMATYIRCLGERSKGWTLEDWRFPLPNVWLGTTIWDQPSADRAVPILLNTPAAKRFVSVEPMLGAVDLTPWLPGSYECALTCGHREGASSRPEVRCVQCGFQGADTYEVWGAGDTEVCPECGAGETEPVCPECGTYMVQEHPDTQYLDWVICGGENGPGARPMHPDWARSLRDQCQSAGVPFFFKQWGEWVSFYDRDIDDPDWRDCPRCDVRTERYVNLAGGHGFHGDRVHAMRRVGARKAGRVLDGREWSEVPS